MNDLYKPISEAPLNTDIIGYNEKWIDKHNPKGIRILRINDIYISTAMWYNPAQQYESECMYRDIRYIAIKPTHFMLIPNPKDYVQIL